MKINSTRKVPGTLVLIRGASQSMNVIGDHAESHFFHSAGPGVSVTGNIGGSRF